ncbi:trehalose-phosphatase [Sphingomonas xinjiangensis]|uniref:Trehalose 6-phosphate phosphatase n=1 Tax=Sphingomonas xinjiangensis TaxID=643568 RepID=A0A840YEN3_9SPHN|nr:trehalose-phosphatase [Sphingomonas xinjiangensis]MBB5710429.1 trehalose 6-phosphate phosphatase [Sphingomonas xinjiangensis]
MPHATLPPPPADLLDGASLFLDFDGTLVELADRPDAVAVDDRLHALMRSLAARLDGRVAIVSGRPAEQIHALFGSEGMTVVGSHGMEFRWNDGRVRVADRPEGMAQALAAMHALADRTPGMLVEDKPLGAALHFRMAPDAEEAAQALASEMAARHNLHLQPGKMMVEVRAGGGDKGAAIRTLMAEPELASTRPLFMGDDHTDEPGFEAVAALGGAGILVGASRPTDATYRLNDVQATLAWLEAACGSAA